MATTPFTPNWPYGYIPSAAEWNADWAKKADFATTQGQTTAFNYGAVGNGIADDTAALNAGLADAAANGLSFGLPKGFTFLISGPLIIPGGSVLRLDGKIFKAPVTNGALQFDMLQIQGSNIVIEGSGVIDGNLANQATAATPSAALGTWYRAYVAGTTWPYNGTSSTDYSACYNNVHISGITIQNTVNWAVNLSLQYSLISGCTFINSHNSPQIINSLSTHFVNCIAEGTQDDGIGIYGGCSYCSVNGGGAFNCGTGPFILSDNSGITNPPNAQPNLGCAILNTISQNCSQAGIFVDGGSSVSAATVATNTLVANNVVYNCSTPLTIRNVTNFRASNNITQQATNAEGAACCYLTGTLNYVTIEGNSLWAQENNACIIVTDDNVANVALLIARNKLCNPGSGGSSFGVQLQCVGSSAYVTVADNEVAGTISVAFADSSATAASVFRGVNSVNNANNQIQMSQGLVIRAVGADTTTGIDMEANGNATFHGGLTVGNGIAISSGNLTITGGEIVSGTVSSEAVSVAGAVALGTGAGGATPGVGFFGTSPVGKLTISGAKGGNVALANLITQLASMGILTDTTT